MRVLFMFVLATALGLWGCGDDATTTTSSGNMTIKGGVGSASSIALSHLEGSFKTQGINPSSLKIETYKVGVFKKADCTGDTSAAEDADNYAKVFPLSENPTAQDWISGPTLFQGDLPDGTYNCVVMEISSHVAFTPEEDSDNGDCDDQTEVTMDVCQTGGSSTLIESVSGVASTTCTTGTSDRIAVYMSTTGAEGSDCGEACGFTPDNPTHLDSALVVSGNTTGTFKMNANGTVAEASNDSTLDCEMDEPGWAFE